tara:strand:- start:1047 stop:1388 length:342 start_codon:yes stop_codon:yes gene_type:complete
MMKLIIFLLFLPLLSIGQSISCDELLEELKYDGDRLDTSIVYDSDAISQIEWYEYQDMLFAVLTFTSSYKEYIYGGWGYNDYDYSNLKVSFETSESKGRFFHQNIRNAKVDCY